MIIHLHPIASNRTTEVSLDDLILSVDGVDFDLSQIPEGGQAIPDDGSQLINIVTREDVHVQFHYDSKASALVQPKDGWSIELVSGAIVSPLKLREENV